MAAVAERVREGHRRLTLAPDDQLIVSMARGAEDALAELYDRFGGVAYGVALRILRDPALAQDAVQDAFLAAWRTAAAFDPARGNASTWLLTLVHRRAVDVVRREERRRADALDERAGRVGRLDRRDRRGARAATRRPGGARAAAARPARGARARLLRRALAVGARRAARRPARHGQEPDVRRARDAARPARPEP